MANGIRAVRDFGMTAQATSRGTQNPADFGSDFNSQVFIIKSMLSRLAGATLVQVKGVSNGLVDILPLVNQIDGHHNGIPHAIIYGCPYFQPQSGLSAVVIQPTVGDIGIAIFADRDISNVIATKGQANPGSFRMFDMSDGLYLGGLPGLNAAPTQFVEFSAAGITITSPVAVIVNAPNVTVNAASSAQVVSPSIILKNTGSALKKLINDTFIALFNGHTHADAQGGNTSAPNNGTAGAGNATLIVQAE